jgi:putative membrane protein
LLNAQFHNAPQPSHSNSLLLRLLVIVAVVIVWSAYRPHDYFTWLLEVLPAVIGLIVLACTYTRFRFTPLVYALICAHMIILLIGGHYTYARVPAFDWLRDALHLGRNHFDRVGHFAQGFVPALITREILLRRKVVARGGWLAVFVISVCLALSALYEFVEWGVAALTGEAAEDFLGTQGDPWDTQKDMFMCLIGSSVALLTLSRLHDRQVANVTAGRAS